jgi:ABC-2 type transport system permease protein
MVEFPYFIDIRASGLATNHAITSSIPQMSMNWASPVNFDTAKNQFRKTTKLLTSSPQAWHSDSLNVLPDFQLYGGLGFSQSEQTNTYQLSGIVEGKFDSYFKGKDSPLLLEQPEAKVPEDDTPNVVSSIIEKSPESARIIVLASNEFLTDQNLQLAASAGGMEYLNSLQLIENAVDWSLEDTGLLSIRSRSHYSRTLFPIDNQAQALWEYVNYALSLLGLFIVWLTYRFYRRKTQQQYKEVLAQSGDHP